MVNSPESTKLQAATMFTPSPQPWSLRVLTGIHTPLLICPLTSVTPQTMTMIPLLDPKMTMRIMTAKPMISKPLVTNKKMSL